MTNMKGENRVIQVFVGEEAFSVSKRNYRKLNYIDNFLINSGNESFYLFSSYVEDGNGNISTPYILCPANKACRYYSSSEESQQLGYTLVDERAMTSYDVCLNKAEPVMTFGLYLAGIMFVPLFLLNKYLDASDTYKLSVGGLIFITAFEITVLLLIFLLAICFVCFMIA